MQCTSQTSSVARSTPLCIAALVSLAGTASADTFTVTTLADGPVAQAGDLPGSLRQALFDAEALAGADTIQFDSSLSGTITLTEGELEIADSLTIDGPGADKITISGGNTSRVLNFGGPNAHTYNLQGVTIADGNGVSSDWDGIGGGILFYFHGDDVLNIDRCVIRDNRTANKLGGAMGFARVNVNITNSSIIDNGGGVGDGGQGIIYAQESTCTIVNSTISGNWGRNGAIWARGDAVATVLTISHSTIVDNNNDAVEFAGDSRTSLDYDHSIFAGNLNNFDAIGSTTVTSGGYNILDDSDDPSPASTDRVNTDPLLGPRSLDENSGTYVFHPTKASPAIEGGDPAAVAGSNGVPSNDQRGNGFLRVVGTLDVGAVEFKGFIVTTLADGPVTAAGDLPGSLRQVVRDANEMASQSTGGGEVIEFADSLSGGTITLTEGEIYVDRTMTFNGLGADNLTISGGNNSRVFRCGGWEPNTYTFRGLTVSDGNGVSPVWTNRGGAFNMYFAHDDTLHIDRCVLRDNTTNPNVNLPFGNAVAVLSGTLIISNSAVIDNGVDNSNDGERSTIYMSENFPSNAHFINTTFSGNTGNEGVVWIRGGFKGIRATFSHCTFADNDNNGVRITGGPTTGADFTHNVFSRNTGANWSFSVNGPINSGGYNIFDDSTARGTIASDLLDTDAMLGSLVLRAGTYIHPLRPGSPALNGGDSTAVAGSNGIPEFDQRGSGFPRVVGRSAQAGEIVGVTIEDVTSEYTVSSDYDRRAVHTINGNGFNVNGPGTHHTVPDVGGGAGGSNPGNMWMTLSTATGVITFDLERSYDLDSVRVWNYNEAAALNRGANLVEILVASGVGGTFTSLGDFTFSQAPGVDNVDFGQTIDLSGFTAADDVRLVRFNIESSHGGSQVGLSEVRFNGASNNDRIDVGAVENTEQYCNVADFAESYGMMDLADINAFVTAFTKQNIFGDIDGNGIWDLTDINMFTSAFLRGCE